MERELQLSLDEMYQGIPHGYDGCFNLEDGFRGRCRCGWLGQLVQDRDSARRSVSGHLALTVPGAKLVALLRHP